MRPINPSAKMNPATSDRRVQSSLRLATLAALLASYLAPAAALADPAAIQPGEVWPDDRGQHIQAHGGGVM